MIKYCPPPRLLPVLSTSLLRRIVVVVVVVVFVVVVVVIDGVVAFSSSSIVSIDSEILFSSYVLGRSSQMTPSFQLLNFLQESDSKQIFICKTMY